MSCFGRRSNKAARIKYLQAQLRAAVEANDSLLKEVQGEKDQRVKEVQKEKDQRIQEVQKEKDQRIQEIQREKDQRIQEVGAQKEEKTRLQEQTRIGEAESRIEELKASSLDQETDMKRQHAEMEKLNKAQKQVETFNSILNQKNVIITKLREDLTKSKEETTKLKGELQRMTEFWEEAEKMSTLSESTVSELKTQIKELQNNGTKKETSPKLQVKNSIKLDLGNMDRTPLAQFFDTYIQEPQHDAAKHFRQMQDLNGLFEQKLLSMQKNHDTELETLSVVLMVQELSMVRELSMVLMLVEVAQVACMESRRKQ
uniref:Uncharacterized protein n=1 Tax=Knipowitschia caucasica TaxID=637954 RepID=A0AAV2J7T5_KNICA